MQLDKKAQIHLTKQITYYNKELTKHSRHNNILPLLFRGGTNTTFLAGLYENRLVVE